MVLAESDAIRSEIVAPAPTRNTQYVISPRGHRVATVDMKGSRFFVEVDGKSGPLVDEVLPVCVQVGESNISPQDRRRGYKPEKRIVWQGPVIFSQDGTHFAYAARIAQETILYLNHQEIIRVPASDDNSRPAIRRISFTPDNQLIYTKSAKGNMNILVIGKFESPPFSGDAWPTFSRDGKRFAFDASTPQGLRSGFLVVDGKEQRYVADVVEFTPDGQRLLTHRNIRGYEAYGQPQLCLEANPFINIRTEKYFISDTGLIVAVGVDRKGPCLWVMGDHFDLGSGRFQELVFSPDGKRWAARIDNGQRQYLLVDGKPGREYDRIQNVTWSGDSTRLFYSGHVRNNAFGVIHTPEGETESEEGVEEIETVVSGGSDFPSFAYVVRNQERQWVIFDNHKGPEGEYIEQLTIDPRLNRYAYLHHSREQGQRVFVDGKALSVPPADYQQNLLLFSPDGKGLAYVGKTDLQLGLVLNEQFFRLQENESHPKLKGFLPNSQSIVWTVFARSDNEEITHWYINDQKVATFGRIHGLEMSDTQEYSIGPEGGLVILGPTLNGEQGGLKRVIVPPGQNLHRNLSTSQTLAPGRSVPDDAEKSSASNPSSSKESLPESSPSNIPTQAPESSSKILDPEQLELYGLKLGVSPEEFQKAGRRSFPQARYDPVRTPERIQLTNPTTREELVAMMNQDNRVFVIRYFKMYGAGEEETALQTLTDRFGPPVTDSGVVINPRGWKVRTLRWTKGNPIKDGVVTGEIITAKDGAILGITLQLPGNHRLFKPNPQ